MMLFLIGSKEKVICVNCKKIGHLLINCPHKGKGKKDGDHDNNHVEYILDSDSQSGHTSAKSESSVTSNCHATDFSSIATTEGLIELLEKALAKPADMDSSSTYYLCSPCPHITQKGVEGSEWSCGYRNIQMLCLSLIKRPEYRAVLFGGRGDIPDVHGIQAWIERAWREGFDLEVRACNMHACSKNASVVSMLVYMLMFALSIGRVCNTR